MFSLGGTDTIIAVTALNANIAEEALTASLDTVLTANIDDDVVLTAEIVQVTSAVMQPLTLSAQLN